MSVELIPVAASDDDGFDLAGSASTGDAEIYIFDGISSCAAFRFALTANPGDLIPPTTLSLGGTSLQFALNTTIHAVAADNAGPIIAGEDLLARPLTTAAVPWMVTLGPEGTMFASPDIAAVLQEVVDRPGYGGHVVLILLTNPGSAASVASFDELGDTTTPFLTVAWPDTPLPEGQPVGGSVARIVPALLADLKVAVSECYSTADPNVPEPPAIEIRQDGQTATIDADEILVVMVTGLQTAFIGSVEQCAFVLKVQMSVTVSRFMPNLDAQGIPDVAEAREAAALKLAADAGVLWYGLHDQCQQNRLWRSFAELNCADTTWQDARTGAGGDRAWITFPLSTAITAPLLA